jgi:hypothetical protein
MHLLVDSSPQIDLHWLFYTEFGRIRIILGYLTFLHSIHNSTKKWSNKKSL